MIVRTLCIVVIRKVGFTTLTEELRATVKLIAAASYTNTALLILLSGANFNDLTLLKWIPVTNGPFPDFNQNWYLFVAPSIIETMVINMFWPQIGFL